MANCILLLNTGDQVLLNTGDLVQLNDDTCTATSSTGLTLSGTHAVPMIGRTEMEVDVEFTFLLKSTLLAESIKKIRVHTDNTREIFTKIRLKGGVISESVCKLKLQLGLIIGNVEGRIGVKSRLLSELQETVRLNAVTKIDLEKLLLKKQLKDMLDDG